MNRDCYRRAAPGEWDHHLEDCINVAVRGDHAKCLRELLVASDCADLYVQDDTGGLDGRDRPLSDENFSPLFLAARDQHEETMKVLYQHIEKGKHLFFFCLFFFLFISALYCYAAC